MKKVIVSMLMSLIVLTSCAQNKFPLINSLGGPKTLNKVTGGIEVANGVIFVNIPDTTTANAMGLKAYPGTLISIGTKLYINKFNKWNLIGDEAIPTSLSIFKKPGLDTVYYNFNGTEFAAFKDSSYNQPLLTNGSVPYVGTNGKLTESPGYFTYIGGNLSVGNGGFYSSTGLYLNQGRAYLTASGFGATFGTTGGTPADASKHIRFMNGSREYLDLNLPPYISTSTGVMEGTASMNWVPKITDSFSLGLSTKQWRSAYIKDLYINGTLFNPNYNAYIPITEKASNNGVATLDNTGKIPLSQLPAITTNQPMYVQTLAEMLGSSAVVGDLYVLGDSSSSYALASLPANDLGNWIVIQAPIPSNTDLLSEGNINKYYTDFRVRNAIGVEGTGLSYNASTGKFSNTRKSDWDAISGSDNEILNKPTFPTILTPIEGDNIRIDSTYPDLRFSVTGIYKNPQIDSISAIIRSEIPVLNSFPSGAIPYGNTTDGRLTYQFPGFNYISGSKKLKVGGNGDFGTTSTLELNGGNGDISASGYGIKIVASGGFPIDPTKSISFYNGSRYWLTMTAPYQPGATLANNALFINSNSHIYPMVTDSFRLGNTGSNWAKVYTKNLRITNGAGADKVWTSINSTGDGEWRTIATGGTGEVSLSQMMDSINSNVTQIIPIGSLYKDNDSLKIRTVSGSQSGEMTPTLFNNLNSAYSWGDHAGLYKAIGYVPTWAEITGKPTIPAAQVNSDWNSISGLSQILNKPTFKTVGGVSIEGIGDIPIGSGGVTSAQVRDSILAHKTIIIPKGPLFKDNDSLKVKVVSISDTGVVPPSKFNEWNAKANASHIHSASDITSGTLPIARGGLGISIIGTIGQSIRVNGAGTGLEYYTPSSSGVSAQDISDSIAANTVKIIPRGAVYKDGDSLKVKMASSSDTGVVTPAKFDEWNAKLSSVPAQTFASLLSKPTTVSGYGIVDAAPLTGIGIERTLIIAASDVITDLTTGTAKAYFNAPYAIQILGVKANVNTVSSSGLITVDINKGATSMLSTKLTIDASEKTSVTAATPAVLTGATMTNDQEGTIDIDGAGTGAKGLLITIYYKRTS